LESAIAGNVRLYPDTTVAHELQNRTSNANKQVLDGAITVRGGRMGWKLLLSVQYF